MGRLIEGVWKTGDAPASVRGSGEWRREPSRLRGWIAADGRTAPDGAEALPAEAGRYLLYAAPNCPWAHRVMLARALLGLEEALPVVQCAPRRTDQGWMLEEGADPLFGASALHQVYAAGAPGHTGRATVPLLADRRTGGLVSNDSADLVAMLDSAFGGDRLRPAALRPRIDFWCERIHRDFNDGVYRAGFAESQQAYEIAALGVFALLDRVEAQLSQTRWLCGDAFTEADLRLFPTVARFDVAYHYAFKLNQAKITDYPALWAWAREVAAMPGVAETLHFDVWRRGYHSANPKRNPLGIVPIGPRLPDWGAPHGRG